MHLGFASGRAASSWRLLEPSLLWQAPRRYLSSIKTHSMSAPEDKDKVDLNLSLPVKPVQSLASRITSGSTQLLPSRPAFALPPRPTGAPPSSTYLAAHSTRGTRKSSLSPPLAREREYSYRPSYARSRDDVYLPTPSPPPRFRNSDDRYIPSPSPPYKSHRSPTPRYRSLSPLRLRSLTPPRRLTPPHRPVSRSPVKRPRSPSPSSSSTRSRSVTPAPRTSFYTRSHLREKEHAERRQKREERNEAREKAKKEKEIQWAAYKKRRTHLDHLPDQS